MKILSLGECYAKATNQDPPIGEEEGTCCFCHQYTAEGHPKNMKTLGSKFTDTDAISAGEVICPYCMLLKHDTDPLRRSMWIITPKIFHRFKRNGVKDALQTKPSPKEPAYIYFTDSYQVLGWPRMIWHANIDPQTLRFGFNRETHTIPRREFQSLMEKAEKLLGTGLLKSDLTGESSNLKRYLKISVTRDLLQELQELRGNRAWQIAVTLTETRRN